LAAINKTDEINKDFITQKRELDSRIANIISQQQRLENYLINLEVANNSIEEKLQTEKDPTKIGKYYVILRKNLDLMLKIHESYKDYEAVKSQYYKLLTELTYRKHRFFEIELKKIDAQVVSAMGPMEFMSFINKQDSGIGTEVEEKLNSDQFKL